MPAWQLAAATRLQFDPQLRHSLPEVAAMLLLLLLLLLKLQLQYDTTGMESTCISPQQTSKFKAGMLSECSLGTQIAYES